VSTHSFAQELSFPETRTTGVVISSRRGKGHMHVPVTSRVAPAPPPLKSKSNRETKEDLEHLFTQQQPEPNKWTTQPLARPNSHVVSPPWGSEENLCIKITFVCTINSTRRAANNYPITSNKPTVYCPFFVYVIRLFDASNLSALSINKYRVWNTKSDESQRQIYSCVLGFAS